MATIDEIYAQVVITSQENVSRLNEKLDEMDKLVADMSQTRDGIKQIPEVLQVHFAAVISLTENHLKDIAAIVESYLSSTDTLLETNLKNLTKESDRLKQEIDKLAAVDIRDMFTALGNEFIGIVRNDLNIELAAFPPIIQSLTDQTNDLHAEVNRLNQVDFAPMFATLQQEFIAKARQDIGIELKKFENETSRLKHKISELETQVSRIASIDLDKHFNSLQSTLAALSGSVTSINLNLNTIAASLSDIGNRQDNLLRALGNEANSTRQKVSELSDSLQLRLSQQMQAYEADQVKLIAKLSSLEEGNQHILKNQKSNKLLSTICIAMLVGVLILLIALLLKH